MVIFLNMQIRLFKQIDQTEVKKFVLGVLDESGFPYKLELDYDLDDPDEFYKKQGGIFYVLEENHKIIGTIAVKNKGDGIAEIKRLYIEKKYRDKHYGSMLFDYALNFCREHGFKKIILDTWIRFNRAKSLYISRGFKTMKTDGEQIFMEKILK